MALMDAEKMKSKLRSKLMTNLLILASYSQVFKLNQPHSTLMKIVLLSRKKV